MPAVTLGDELDRVDTVWIKKRRRKSLQVYHTSPECSRIQAAGDIRAKDPAVLFHDTEKCDYCRQRDNGVEIE